MEHDQPEYHVAPRLAKLERLRELGIDPYPVVTRRTHTAAEALAAFDESRPVEVAVAGRIVGGIRGHGKTAFCHAQDASGRIQLYLKLDVLGPERFEEFRLLDVGDFLEVRGPLFKTRTGETTVEVHEFRPLAKALRPLPEKWHGLVDVETRYRQRYLDLLANEESRRVFLLRSQIVRAVRGFYDARGYVEVETPVLQAVPGGAAARPFETHHNALDQRLYLRIALELHLKRLIVGGIDRVYEIGRIFRNEGISTRHNPEFTMVESYEAYADYRGMMALFEGLVSTVAREVLGTTRVTYQGVEVDLAPPWRRLSVRDAILEYAGIDYERFPERDALSARVAELGVHLPPATSRGKIVDELRERFVEKRLLAPTFLHDYPVEVSPLAKSVPEQPDDVERFEAYAGGIELANAYSELNDPIDQRRRFDEQARQRAAGDDEAQRLDEDFLVALEHGMPPTGGLGFGIDRLVMLLTDSASIRDVVLFPHMRAKD